MVAIAGVNDRSNRTPYNVKSTRKTGKVKQVHFFMSEQRTSAETPARIPPAGLRVKARIIEAGITMAALARAANIAPNTLSDYIAGRCRRRETQMDIHWAFRQLTGVEITLVAFWGSLLGRIFT